MENTPTSQEKPTPDNLNTSGNFTEPPLTSTGDTLRDVQENTVPHIITKEDLDNNPELGDAGIQVGEEVEFGGEPTFDEALQIARDCNPKHTITVQRNGDIMEVFVVHDSTPSHLYKATGILDTLRNSNGVVGPHVYLKSSDEQELKDLLITKLWNAQ